jgi:hypothetical protein
MPGHVYRDNAISPAHPFSPQMVGSAYPPSWQQNRMDAAVGSRGSILAACTVTSGKAEADWVRQYVKWGMQHQSDVNVWDNSLEQSPSWGVNLCSDRIQEPPSILWKSKVYFRTENTPLLFPISWARWIHSTTSHPVSLRYCHDFTMTIDGVWICKRIVFNTYRT